MTETLFKPLPKAPRELSAFFVSDIQPLLQKLRSASKMDDAKGHLADLKGLSRWLVDQGIVMDGLELKSDAGIGQKSMGSGVYATRAFAVNVYVSRISRLCSCNAH